MWETICFWCCGGGGSGVGRAYGIGGFDGYGNEWQWLYGRWEVGGRGNIVMVDLSSCNG